MKDDKPLQGETVIFTGTPKSKDVFDLVTQYGGVPISFPLIQVKEIRETTDELRMLACPTYDWLIFTSQSAVDAFQAKLERYQIPADTIRSQIAAVGTRTAEALEGLGFRVDFIPTVFSADTLVKEFRPEQYTVRRVLFLRGTMAGSLIKEELPFDVDEWTVYETVSAEESADALIQTIQEKKMVNVLFASPSAVNVFAQQVVPVCGWNGYTIGAIGHVTENALLDAGATVHVRPDTYTLMDLVNTLAGQKEGNKL
ncbi:uroporphyrinogen-III synthase [Sporosarcina sp. HYO08]|uniref:uroporphyrinogen-III synthase n=1 Tax=Sporosarcina sp. HYO08 TaxID=1759557 RepID=UPI000794B2D4|nr:uroporphyrinogen-III synthase [Sporosarcina sp. HYO08]KXH87296.1 hypothetical protein AU377_01605 [Sporosarcina sp. HYO08]